MMDITFFEPSLANAGPDNIVCGTDPFMLEAITNGTGMWTGGSGTYTDDTDPNSFYSADASEEGTTIILTWTTSDPDGTGPCDETSDQVEITINEDVTYSAGLDFTACSTDVILLDASSNVGGSWSGGAGLFSDNSDPHSEYDPAPSEVGNSVVLTWTTNDPDGAGPCIPRTDDVEITINEGATADAGADQIVCSDDLIQIMAIANGPGMWSGGNGIFDDASSPLTAYTATADEVESTITLTWTTEDPDDLGPCMTASDDVEITINEAAVADAGNDIEVCEGDIIQLNALDTEGMWSGGAGSFDEITDPNTIYTALASEIGIGVTLTWTSVDPDGAGPCTEVSDDVFVQINAMSTANAGPDQVVCDLQDIQLDGGANNTGSWSGGAGSYDDNTDLDAIYTPDGSELGTTITLTWTSDDPDGIGPCLAVSDEMDITFNIPATADAGNDIVSCGIDDIDLNADNTSGTWTGGMGSFDNANDPDAVYSPIIAEIGTSFILTWTTDDPDGDGPCMEVADDVEITINTPAVSNAGNDQAFCELQNAIMDASPIGPGEWTGGLGSFDDINAADAEYTPDASEMGTTVVLTWTIEDPDGLGPCDEVSDEMQISYGSPAVVNAGEDFSVCEDGSITLNATSSGSGSWSGGMGSFSNPLNVNAIYSPDASEIGTTVVLTWTADDPDADGPCTEVSDDVEITIVEFPTVTAIDDFTICEGDIIQLGSVIGGSAFHVAWSSNSTGSFDDDNALNPIYTPSQVQIEAGLAIVSVTVLDENLVCDAVSDEVIITINTLPSLDAGSDVIVCGTNDVQLNGSSEEDGAWSGGLGSFSDVNDINSYYTPSAGEIGTAVSLTWTTIDPDGDGPCNSISDDVLVNVNRPALVDAGANQIICEIDFVQLAAITSGAGSWSGGDGVYTDTSDPNTTYLPAVNELGNTISLTWTVDDPDGAGPCTSSSDFVEIQINESITADAGNDIETCGEGANPI